MNPFNSQCLNLGGCVGGFSASAAKTVKKQETLVVLDSNRPLVPSAEFASFPADISQLVGDYASDSDKEYVDTIFAGVQPINLCLSQDVGSELASCWSIGFLPYEKPWDPLDVKIDKQFPITDHKRCLDFLNQKNSNYCRMAIELLVVKLSKTSNDFPSALYNLRIIIEMLEDHLSSVKHFVISIEDNVSCCFALYDAIGKADEMRQSVYHSKGFFKIINDLNICLSDYHTLTVDSLFGFYFKSEVKPASEMYLAKFVIPLSNVLNRKLFDEEASKMLSAKIMWVFSLTSVDDSFRINQNTTRLCHAFDFDTSGNENDELRRIFNRVRDALFFQDNRFIERIVINLNDLSLPIHLPQPRSRLTDKTPRSALIELTLEGKMITFDLTTINNDYFPHLVHLSIIVGKAKGHLDSHHVPRLKTLRIELVSEEERSSREISFLVRELTQTMIGTGRPWQLVASKSSGGWSLASYDDSTANPQDDAKEDSSHSPQSRPFIRELMLVVNTQKHANEFQSRLNGNLPLKAATKNHNDGLLMWAPECVEKITAFCMSGKVPRLEFKEEIPGNPRILTSLTCHSLKVLLDGDVLPQLQSLKMIDSWVTLSKEFLRLKTLSFEEGTLESPWEVDALLLESLNCLRLGDGNNLSLRPQLLPHLSYLRIELLRDNPLYCPTILVDGDHLGLLRNTHAVFGKGMVEAPFFDQWQVHKVSHLEMAVDARKLPASGFEWVLQCETLIINFYGDNSNRFSGRQTPFIRVPLQLPRVKKLMVTEDRFRLLLDSEMLELTDLTVPSPKSLGPNLRCPVLKYICFTDDLSESGKEKCLDRATYRAIGGQPRWVFFDCGRELKRMSWDVAPSSTGASPLAGLLGKVD